VHQAQALLSVPYRVMSPLSSVLVTDCRMECNECTGMQLRLYCCASQSSSLPSVLSYERKLRTKAVSARHIHLHIAVVPSNAWTQVVRCVHILQQHCNLQCNKVQVEVSGASLDVALAVFAWRDVVPCTRWLQSHCPITTPVQ
jgi:hypothetical protein